MHLSIFILVINRFDAQNFCFTVSLFHASTCFEHHVLIIRRPKLYYTASGIITPIGVMILVINQRDAQNFCFTVSLFHASTCFEHHVLVIRRPKLYYTASCIITPIGVMILVINQRDAQNFCFTISLFHASTCFEHHVLVIRRSKLYHHTYITPIDVMIPEAL